MNSKQLYTVPDIAEALGVGYKRVINLIHWHGVKPVSRGQYSEQAFKLIAAIHERREAQEQLKRLGPEAIKLEVVEVPRYITKEVVYHVYESRLNYTDLNDL